jgi:hypothetical protein
VELGVERGKIGDWNQEAFVEKLGNGALIKFWTNDWVGVVQHSAKYFLVYTRCLHNKHNT